MRDYLYGLSEKLIKQSMLKEVIIQAKILLLECLTFMDLKYLLQIGKSHSLTHVA